MTFNHLRFKIYLEANEFGEEDKTNPVFTVIEARVAEYIGELERAKKLYLQLNELEHESNEHLMRAALIDYRRGVPKDALDLLLPNIRKW